MNVTYVQRLVPPLKMWATQIEAVNQATGQVCTFCGPLVPGPTRADAQRYCHEHGLGYCEVIGIVVEREVVIEINLN